MGDKTVGPKIIVPRQGVQAIKYVEKYNGKKCLNGQEYPDAKGQIIKREGAKRYFEVVITSQSSRTGRSEVDPIATETREKIYVDAHGVDLIKVEQEKPKRQTASRSGKKATKARVAKLETRAKRPPGAIGTYKYNPSVYVYRDEKGLFIYKDTKGSVYHGDVLDGAIRVDIKESEVIKF